jgi:hypothetical protein
MFWKKKKSLPLPPPPMSQQSRISKSSYCSGLDVNMISLNMVKTIVLEFPEIGKGGYHLNNFGYDLEYFVRDNAGKGGVLQFNRNILHKYIRLLKDENGYYLFNPGFGKVPNTVCNYQYEICPSIPDNQIIYKYYSKKRITNPNNKESDE